MDPIFANGMFGLSQDEIDKTVAETLNTKMALREITCAVLKRMKEILQYNPEDLKQLQPLEDDILTSLGYISSMKIEGEELIIHFNYNEDHYLTNRGVDVLRLPLSLFKNFDYKVYQKDQSQNQVCSVINEGIDHNMKQAVDTIMHAWERGIRRDNVVNGKLDPLDIMEELRYAMSTGVYKLMEDYKKSFPYEVVITDISISPVTFVCLNDLAENKCQDDAINKRKYWNMDYHSRDTIVEGRAYIGTGTATARISAKFHGEQEGKDVALVKDINFPIVVKHPFLNRFEKIYFEVTRNQLGGQPFDHYFYEVMGKDIKTRFEQMDSRSLWVGLLGSKYDRYGTYRFMTDYFGKHEQVEDYITPLALGMWRSLIPYIYPNKIDFTDIKFTDPGRDMDRVYKKGMNYIGIQFIASDNKYHNWIKKLGVISDKDDGVIEVGIVVSRATPEAGVFTMPGNDIPVKFNVTQYIRTQIENVDDPNKYSGKVKEQIKDPNTTVFGPKSNKAYISSWRVTLDCHVLVDRGQDGKEYPRYSPTPEEYPFPDVVRDAIIECMIANMRGDPEKDKQDGWDTRFIFLKNPTLQEQKQSFIARHDYEEYENGSVTREICSEFDVKWTLEVIFLSKCPLRPTSRDVPNPLLKRLDDIEAKIKMLNDGKDTDGVYIDGVEITAMQLTSPVLTIVDSNHFTDEGKKEVTDPEEEKDTPQVKQTTPTERKECTVYSRRVNKVFSRKNRKQIQEKYLNHFGDEIHRYSIPSKELEATSERLGTQLTIGYINIKK